MANRVEFDLYCGTGIAPVIREQVVDPLFYQGSFSSYEDARIEAQRYVKAGSVDWYAIHCGQEHMGGWQSGLTGSRQREQAKCV